MIRKSINSILITAILTTQVGAWDLSEHVNSTNVSPSNWQSPTTKIRYRSSGSVNFTFKKKSSFAPIFTSNASGSFVDAGCSGVSIKDMYVGLLDMDEIEEQLKESGSQFAWGVALALISSLPVIGEVFNMLQDWAKTIQNLLDNACSLGQAFMNDKVLSKEAHKNLDKLHSFNTTGYLDDVMEGTESAREWIDNLVTNANCGSFTGDAKVKCENDISAVASGVTSDTVNFMLSHGDGLLKELLEKSRISKVLSKKAILITPMKKFLDSGKIDIITLYNSSEMEDIRHQYYLRKLFLLPIQTIDKNIIAEQLDEFTDCPSTKIDTTSSVKCKFTHAKIGAFAKDGISNLVNKQTTTLQAILSSPKDVVKVLLDGITEDIGKTGQCSLGECKLPNENIVLYDFIDKVNKNGKPASFARALAIVPLSGYSSEKIEWKGAVYESIKSIKKLVKERSGKDATIGILNYPNIDGSSMGNIPLVVPGYLKYIEVIADLEKKVGAETAYTASLKELLAKFNAYLFGKAFIDNIFNQYKSSNENTAEQKKLLKLREETFVAFEKILKETADYKTVIEIFEKIELNMRKETSRNLNR